MVKKKILRGVENDCASLDKQMQHFDMFDLHDVEEVSSMNKPSSRSMVKMLTIHPVVTYSVLSGGRQIKMTIE